MPAWPHPRPSLSDAVYIDCHRRWEGKALRQIVAVILVSSDQTRALCFPSCLYVRIRGIMRRILSTFLVGVMALGYLLPLVMASVGDSTPACCRRNGKHQCMMHVSAGENPSGNVPHVKASASACPYRDLLGPATISAEVIRQVKTASLSAIKQPLLAAFCITHSRECWNSSFLRGPPLRA